MCAGLACTGEVEKKGKGAVIIGHCCVKLNEACRFKSGKVFHVVILYDCYFNKGNDNTPVPHKLCPQVGPSCRDEKSTIISAFFYHKRLPRICWRWFLHRDSLCGIDVVSFV